MTTPPTTFGQRTAEYLGYQMATRPRLRRFITFWLSTQLLGTWSVVAAPPAAASTLAGALNWTGVADSYGVPVGDYYLSVVSTSEAITKAGPGLSADPSSWARWLANAVTTGLTHEGIVELLQAQAAVYIFMIAMALWLMRFAMSNTWLYWLATWSRPLFDTIRAILADLWVFPICLLLGLGIGAYHILWHGRKGFGSGILLSTFVISILGTLLTNNPLTDLYSENGLLTQGRNLGFSAAQAFANNGPIAPGGGQAQLQHLIGLIADATLRMPLQLMNFGTPVDNIGTCANAYTAAILTPHDSDLAGPAHAMAACGAPQALSFAQHLNGANLALGTVYGLLGAIFTAFVCYVTYSYGMVCCAAFINALLSIAVAAPAMIHGAPRRRAARRLKMFFKHTALVFAYTAYISIAALIVLKMAARGGYADQVGMTHPLARLFMISIISAVAIGVFWWLKRELGDHTRQDLTHLVTEVTHRARDGYQRGQDAYDRARNLKSRAPWTKNQTPDRPDSPDGPDQPFTGCPAQGRPPGGRPPSPGHQRGLAPGPQPPSTAPAGAAATTSPATAVNATGAASGVAAGGKAAAAVVAPEAVAGAAIASHITQRLHRDHTARASQTNSRPTNSATPRAQSGPAPGSTQPPAEPVAGRTSNSRPNPSQRPSPAPATGRDRPNTRPHPDHGDPVDEAPVKGR